MDSPATNEEPICVIFRCISTFFRKNKTDHTFKIGTIYTGPSGPDECTKWMELKLENRNYVK